MTMDFFAFQQQMAKRREETPPKRQPLTISQLTAQIERTLASSFPERLLVKGEASNLNLNQASGHLYFTLKDAHACIECVMYRSDADRLRFTPEDGMELLTTGQLMVYAPRGRYQLRVTRLDPVGRGALEVALRQLQAKLEAEGLFAAERKKPLPAYPQRVAIVTSTNTAALQDILKVLRRFTWLKLMVYHVPVQGQGAGQQIAQALADLGRGAEGLGGIDVIILARGGGSLEDLWEFNQECVARAIAASHIPVVTGVGHEIDVSIADLVADYHAHTPTEAAQVVTTRWREAREELEQQVVHLGRLLRALLQQARQRLSGIERHELFRRPLDRVNSARQLLDDRHKALALAMGARLRKLAGQVQAVTSRLEQYRPASIVLRYRSRLAGAQQRLTAVMASRLGTQRQRLSRLMTALGERHPRHALVLAGQRLAASSRRLSLAMQRVLQRRRQGLEARQIHLNALGPEQVLKRGYSITTLKKGGKVVRSAQDVKEGDRLVTRLADGQVESTVQDKQQLPLFE
jgi:exodeoxyribonuclease VII large subunit